MRQWDLSGDSKRRLNICPSVGLSSSGSVLVNGSGCWLTIMNRKGASWRTQIPNVCRKPIDKVLGASALSNGLFYDRSPEQTETN